MKNIKKIIFIVVVFIALYSCSTKKDTLINRNYHALTTKYNVLFNGKVAFNKGIEAINSGYKDDWFEQLPIEPIKFEQDKIVDIPKYSGMGAGFSDDPKKEKQAATPFDKSEEKMVKAIQKHGMEIDGEERNTQIDEAYLLLGKDRYYTQRFVPAIEAFNYIITSYPFASLISETKIWRAKANIRLDNEELAIETLKLLLKESNGSEKNLPDEIKEQAHTALAMAYAKMDSLQKVKEHLIKATRTLNNKPQAARNLFILGQLYSSENKKDTAIITFNKLINVKKAPEKYKIHAQIEIAKNTTNNSAKAAVLNKMNELITVRENKKYLNELYYQVGVLHESNDSIQLAIDAYNKSLKAENSNIKQKTFTYEKLGNINFKNSNYLAANSYYDSILKISTDTLNLRIRRIKRKYKNLKSLISYENILTKNDSILKIAAMSKEDQETYFQKYIDQLKKKDEDAAQLKLNQQAFGNSFGGNSLQSNKGKWYFYNSQSLSFGKAEFKKIWGDRKLADDWRWSSKANSTETKDIATVIQKNPRYDLESYIKTIPTNIYVIDTLELDRNQALYELGIIYKEQFKDTKLAIKRLERVDTLNQKEELILPINWHLYQIYNNQNNTLKAAIHKNIILTKYAETKFAQIIQNPNSVITEEVQVSELEEVYKQQYYLYKDSKYEEVVLKINELLPKIQNSTLIAKFELLKAYAIGKHQDKETYKNALEYVSVNYGNTEEGKKSQEIINQLIKK